MNRTALVCSAVACAALLAGVGSAPERAASADPLAAPVDRVLDALFPAARLAAGVTHREFTTTQGAGAVVGDLIEADLAEPGIAAELMTPGKVAATATVPGMAKARGAVAAINGDFFDLGGTGAALGPAIQDGRALKSAIPPARRAAPPLPHGATAEDVLGVGTDRIARVDRLTLHAGAATPDGEIRVTALNQHVLPEGGVGLFTADWGSASRTGSTCGSDIDPAAGCSASTREIVVRQGAVTGIRDAPGQGQIPLDTQILVGRDAGAEALLSLRVGDRVHITHQLVAASGASYEFAVGGTAILARGVPLSGLDDRERAPRSAIGVVDGRRLSLVTVDGRQDSSVGTTLAELAQLLVELGVHDAVNLDGGGSSTLTLADRPPGPIRIVNSPSDPHPRPVANAVAIRNTR